MRRQWLTTLVCLASSASLIGCGSDPARHRVLAARVVFIGDSITAYWAQQKPEEFATHPWIDKGIPGQTSTQIAERFERDVIALHPDTVHILAGTNDVYPGWSLCSLPPGHATPTSPPTWGGWPYPVDTCSNLLYMVATAELHHIRVVLGTIPPWGVGPLSSRLDSDPDRYARIDRLNGWILRFGADLGVTVVDYHTLLAAPDQKHYAAGDTTDGVHPTAQAYAYMTSAAETAITQPQPLP